MNIRKLLKCGLLFPCAAMGACSSSCEKAKEIPLKASAESVAFREKLFGQGALPAGMTEEELFQATMASLQGRGKEVMPDVGTSHPHEKELLGGWEVDSIRSGNGDCIVLMIHGGSWIHPLHPMLIAFSKKVSDRLGAQTYFPLYPLAPEAGYRESYEMLMDVYEALLEKKKPIFIMGNSAGATLALGLAQRIKAAGLHAPEKVVLISPCPDLTFTNPEIDVVQLRDRMLPKKFSALCAEKWANGTDCRSPEVSPLFGDFAGFPDTLLFAGDYDILYPDNLLLAEKIEKAGAKLTFVNGEGFWHVFPLNDIPEQEQCMELIQKFCQE